MQPKAAPTSGSKKRKAVEEDEEEERDGEPGRKGGKTERAKRD